MKSFTLVAIATLATTAAALAAPHPGSVFEMPVAVPVDQNESYATIQQQEQQVELPPATISTSTAAAVTRRPCTSSSARQTATAIAVDESLYYNPIQQDPVVTATATAAVTSSALPTVAPTPSPTEVPRKRKCIRYRKKTAVPATTAATAEDFGYGKPGKTDVASAIAPAKAATTAAYEQPAETEPVAKDALGETSAGFKHTVGGAAVVVMMLGAGLLL